jgi:hypothetical protein
MAMLLGDILSEIERTSSTDGIAALLDDLVLLAKVNEAAAYRGVDAESYVISAIKSFEREANSTDWTTLMSALAVGHNPGVTCVKRMIERAVMKDSA